MFFVESGTVAVNDVTIAHAMAQGGDGGNGGTEPAAVVAVASAPGRRCSSMTALW